MAQITIRNLAVDMRLQDDWYGVPRYRQLDTFLNDFTAVRTQVVLSTTTTYQLREWDAANHPLTLTINGNLAYGHVTRMAVEALGLRVSVNGDFQVNIYTKTITGWETAESIDDIATGTRLLDIVKIHNYVSMNDNSIPDQDDAAALAGRDTITAGSGNDYLLGYGGADLLQGGGGADTLDGGAGTDTMKGGGGDDTYYVNAVGDLAREEANAGTDTVNSSVSYRLGQNLEHLTLTGAAGISGTGNAGHNTITGNAGDNTLDGGPGRDRMAGGAGHDTYVVDNSGDVVTELPGQGTDIVRSAITFTLPAEVERVTLTGAMAISGFGNALNNVMQGNDAGNRLLGRAGNDTLNGGGSNDTLAGGEGRDSLSGGWGADTFLFDTAPVAGTVDTITDFDNYDTIALGRTIFTSIGASGHFVGGDGRLYAAAGARAGQDGDDRVVYDSGSGALYYDADGSGPLAAVKIAILGTVTHPSLAANHLLVV